MFSTLIGNTLVRGLENFLIRTLLMKFAHSFFKIARGTLVSSAPVFSCFICSPLTISCSFVCEYRLFYLMIFIPFAASRLTSLVLLQLSAPLLTSSLQVSRLILPSLDITSSLIQLRNAKSSRKRCHPRRERPISELMRRSLVCLPRWWPRWRVTGSTTRVSEAVSITGTPSPSHLRLLLLLPTGHWSELI